MAGMEVKSVSPWDRCNDLGEDGFAPERCHFSCRFCGHLVHFDNKDLVDRHVRTSSENKLFFLLNESHEEAFADVIERHVRGLFDRFITDYNCPDCKAPIAIMWRWDENEEHGSRYEPLTLLEAVDWSRD